MDSVQITSQLTTIFRDVFDEDDLELTPNLTADQVDGWDSLTHLRLILSVERAFKVKFSAAETGKLKNVGDLVSLIAAKLQVQGK